MRASIVTISMPTSEILAKTSMTRPLSRIRSRTSASPPWGERRTPPDAGLMVTTGSLGTRLRRGHRPDGRGIAIVRSMSAGERRRRAATRRGGGARDAFAAFYAVKVTLDPATRPRGVAVVVGARD